MARCYRVVMFTLPGPLTFFAPTVIRFIVSGHPDLE
jgi:hypothetical protein